MEREMTSWAALARPLYKNAGVGGPEVASAVASRVYTTRQGNLVPGVALLPAFIGCLFLSGGMGLFVQTGQINDRVYVESVRPENAGTIWEKQIKPLQSAEFNLTLDLRHTLRAVDAQDGHVLWSVPLPEIAATSAPLVFTERHKVFVSIATAQGAIYLLNGINGNLLWMQHLSDKVEVSPLQIQNTMIAVACSDGKIYGMSVTDGHIAYMIQTDSQITSLEPIADNRGEHIYAIADQKRVLALNAMTGDLLWNRETAGTAMGSPILTAGKIITSTVDGNAAQLWAFDGEGNLSWMSSFKPYQSLASAEGYLAIAEGSIVTLIKAETGEAIHYWQLGRAPEDLTLTSANGQLIVKTDQGNLTSALN
jgi:outer membrane protein assembly factor BamB